jgi:hypothetical protein
MHKVGVLGTLVWDEIYGRDPASAPVQEWGGIAYALAGFEASLPAGWQLVPLIKVGRDLSAQARELMATFSRLAPGARCVEVQVPNNRVTLRYQSEERRCERMSGGVPGWTWSELGPMVTDLDALYVNFISGFEMGLGTAQALRRGIQRPIYADLHSLLLAMPQDGVRVPCPLPDAAGWLGCFDVVQVNEDEMRQLSPDPLTLAADTIAAGVSLLAVTLGPRGAIYVAAPGFDRLTLDRRVPGAPSAHPIRTARVEGERVDVLDPTGCGDVFGAALFSRLLAGDPLATAMAAANRLAGRAATYRGASGLARHLRGELLAV